MYLIVISEIGFWLTFKQLTVNRPRTLLTPTDSICIGSTPLKINQLCKDALLDRVLVLKSMEGSHAQDRNAEPWRQSPQLAKSRLKAVDNLIYFTSNQLSSRLVSLSPSGNLHFANKVNSIATRHFCLFIY